MNASADQPRAVAAARDPLRPLRYLWRVPLLLLHLGVALPLTLLLRTLGLEGAGQGEGDLVEPAALHCKNSNSSFASSTVGGRQPLRPSRCASA